MYRCAHRFCPYFWTTFVFDLSCFIASTDCPLVVNQMPPFGPNVAPTSLDLTRSAMGRLYVEAGVLPRSVHGDSGGRQFGARPGPDDGHTGAEAPTLA